MTEVCRLVITGLVQGVGFRHAMTAQAGLLGITGWVRNRRDGSVEAMIAGAAGDVARMIDWARRGPAGAEVADVSVEAASGEFSRFEQRPSA